MKRAVIDTNIIISWYRSGLISLDDLSSVAPIFSVITQIEVLGFQGIGPNEIRAIQNILGTGELIYVDQAIASQTIAIRQKNKIKTPDAIIAATALVQGVELWTANTSDFVKVKGLELFNPL
jgi:predicted nucleic acid-binding protein